MTSYMPPPDNIILITTCFKQHHILSACMLHYNDINIKIIMHTVKFNNKGNSILHQISLLTKPPFFFFGYNQTPLLFPKQNPNFVTFCPV